MQYSKQAEGHGAIAAGGRLSAPSTEASAASGRLIARRVAVPALDPATIAAMWSVFRQYYADISESRFLADLHEKQWVILLLDEGDRSVQGFSTIQVLRRRFEGREYLAVYSGDTIIHAAYWGQTALQAGFYRFLMRLMLSNPFTPVYWFLISKGFKTYLLVSRGCPDYWPRHDQPTPPRILGMLDQLASEKFGDAWQPATGILHFATPAGRLREGVAPISAELLSHPDIRFFAERNPGHAQGDELCCLARIDLKLALFYVGKLARKRWQRLRRRSLRSAPAAARVKASNHPEHAR